MASVAKTASGTGTGNTLVLRQVKVIFHLQIPSGTTANLTILDTVYPITVRRTIEPRTTTKGAQRRLSLLGYELGGIDGQVGKLTDNATSNLQADSDLDADGVIGNLTRTQLQTKFGE